MQAFRYKDINIYLYDDGHMTNMTVMSIYYGKSTLKTSSPEPLVNLAETRYEA